MFDVVRNNKAFSLVLLALVAITFVLFGSGNALRDLGRDTTVAKVGPVEISAEEFLGTMREKQAKYEQRDELLDWMISEKLADLQVIETRLMVSDQAFKKVLLSEPNFRENGKFSTERYLAALSSNRLSEQGFKQRLARQQLFGAISESAVVPTATVDSLVAMNEEIREIATADLPAERYNVRVKLAPDAAKKFYDADLKRWKIPEQVKVEYVVLSAPELAAQITVSDEAARKFYEDKANDRLFVAPPERQARHILILVPKDATPEKRKAAKDKIEGLLKQVRAKPDSFAQIAQDNSEDKGSAAKGGDLGFFGRGQMVKPFEDASFALKPGEISDVVTSDFGYHIIKLEDVRGGGRKSFEEARATITEEIKRREANEKLAQQAEDFRNTIFDLPDSVKPAADKYKLALHTSDWLAKDTRDQPAPLNNPKVLAAIFAPDSIRKRTNTAAVDIGNGALISARVLDYKPAGIKKFEEVRPQIELLLTSQEAVKLAKAEGEAMIARLRKGESLADLKWAAPVKASMSDPGSVPPDVIKAALREPAGKLPAYTGLEAPNRGYTLIRITAVDASKKAGEETLRKSFASKYKQALAQADIYAYMKGLRGQFKVDIHQPMLDILTKDKDKEISE